MRLATYLTVVAAIVCAGCAVAFLHPSAGFVVAAAGLAAFGLLYDDGERA